MSKTILVVSQRGISASSFLFKFAQEIELEHLNLDVDYTSILKLEEKLSKKAYDIILMSPSVVRVWKDMQQTFMRLLGHASIVAISDEDWRYMNVPHIILTIEEVK